MMINSFGLIPSFYFVDSVDASNFYLDFDEGSGELAAQVSSGAYTLTELADAIAAAMNSVGTQAYTVSFNRVTRIYTISAPGTFSLKITTGTHAGASIYPLIGFSGADTAFTISHIGNSASGTEYVPQFPLQSYIDQEDYQNAVSASINKSANGSVEVVKFGTEKFYEFNITFATNIDQGLSTLIRTNLTGVNELRAFMRFCTSKRNLEFMPNYNDKSTFVKILLEKTHTDDKGVGYKLIELYSKNIPGYFETDVLKFRLVES